MLYDQVSIKGLQTTQNALCENGRGMKLGMCHDFYGHFKFEFKLVGWTVGLKTITCDVTM